MTTAQSPPSQPPIIPEDSAAVKGMRIGRWLVWFVWLYFAFVVVILTVAFFLLLFNANPEAGFVEWIYRSADRAMEPFRGIFPAETTGSGSVIDFSILFAMVVYGIIATLVSAFVSFLDRKVAEDRQKALYVAQEEQRRREAAAAEETARATAQYEAEQRAQAARLAADQAAAQQRTAAAAEQLAAERPPSPPQTPPPPV